MSLGFCSFSLMDSPPHVSNQDVELSSPQKNTLIPLLSGIVYVSKDKWSVWINDVCISSAEPQDQRIFDIINVTWDYVEIKWYGKRVLLKVKHDSGPSSLVLEDISGNALTVNNPL